MNFLNRLRRYGSVAVDQEEADTQEYRQAKKRDYADEPEDHDYGKSAIPDRYNLDLIEKGKGKYWMTKQFVKEKLGVGEDQFSVAEDAELLEQVHRARHTQKQMILLSQALAKYQKSVQALTSKETALGMLLAAYGESEASAGMPGSDAVLHLGLEEGVEPCRELMTKLGDALQKDARLMSEMDSPVETLSQEVESFRGKSMKDCVAAISELNNVKRHFRGALLWMTDAANSLSDPDAKKELSNFREAQHMVKVSKKEYEEAARRVSVKVELLLASLNSLLAMHLPRYVNVMGEWLRSSESNYKDVHEWSRVNLVQQFRAMSDVQREHAAAAGASTIAMPADEGFANFGSRDGSGLDAAAGNTARFENWSNEIFPVASPVAHDREHALDWLLGDGPGGDNSSSVPTRQPQEPQSAEVAADDQRALEQNLDWLLAGDETDLEEMVPMNQQMKERQQLAVAHEEKVALDLESLLAGLDLGSSSADLADSQPAKEVATKPGDTPHAEEKDTHPSLNNVSLMWAELGRSFDLMDTPGAGLDSEQSKPSMAREQSKSSTKGLSTKGLVSRAKKEPVAEEAAGSLIPRQEEAAPRADKYASILSRLDPFADQRLLEGLLSRDPDCEDDDGVALM